MIATRDMEIQIQQTTDKSVDYHQLPASRKIA